MQTDYYEAIIDYLRERYDAQVNFDYVVCECKATGFQIAIAVVNHQLELYILSSQGAWRKRPLNYIQSYFPVIKLDLLDSQVFELLAGYLGTTNLWEFLRV